VEYEPSGAALKFLKDKALSKEVSKVFAQELAKKKALKNP
jgi:hypothetical protein